MVAGIMKRAENMRTEGTLATDALSDQRRPVRKVPHHASACRRPGRPERNGFDFGIEDFHAQTKSRNIIAVFLGTGVLMESIRAYARRYQVMPAGSETPRAGAQHLNVSAGTIAKFPRSNPEIVPV